VRFDPVRGRMAVRLLLRSFRLRGGSFLLALLAITVGATVTAAILNIRADLVAKMSRELRAYGPNLIVAPAGARPVDGAPASLDEAAVRSAAGASEGRWAPYLLASGTIAAPNAGSVPAAIAGSDFAALRRINPSWRVEGEWPASGADAPGVPPPVLVGASLARRAGLHPGSGITLRVGGTFLRARVAGVVGTGEAEDDQAFLPLATLQAATGQSGRLSLAAFVIDGGMAAAERAAAALTAALPGASARPLRQIAAAQGALLGRLDRMMTLMTVVVLLLAALCLVMTLMGMVVERAPEIGLQRSLGAGDGAILAMFLGEVGLLGLVGAGLGLVLGAVSARLIGGRLFGAAIAARASTIPWVLAASLLVCAVAVLVPLRRVLSIQPAEALRGD
jgi:putative ABC transport system permease protein